jgi:DNA-binding NarL/FixJ family response regulator
MASPATVFVVEDDDVTRRLLTAYFQARPELALGGVAEDADGLRNLLAQRIPDAVVLDLELPDARGPALLLEIKADCPQCRVVVFSATPGEERGAYLATLGADAYVDKPDVAELHRRLVALLG